MDCKVCESRGGNFKKVINKFNNRSSHLGSFVIDVLVSSLLVWNASVREQLQKAKDTLYAHSVRQVVETSQGIKN